MWRVREQERLILTKGITYKMTQLYETWGNFEELKDNCGLNVDSKEEMEGQSKLMPEVTLFIY